MGGNYKYSSLKHDEALDFRSHFTFSDGKTTQDKYGSYFPTSKDPLNLTKPRQNCIDCFCTSIVIFLSYLAFIVTLPFSGLFTFKMVHQYERIVAYRLGRLAPIKGPGLVLVLPCIDRWHRVDLRTKAFNIPPSKVCTTDGCIVSVGAIIHFRIQNPLLMSLSVQDVNHAMRDGALSDMTNLLSKKSYHDLQSKRQRLSYDLQVDINQSCKEWGAEVSRVELSEITLLIAPQNRNPSPFMPMYGAPLPPEQPQMPFGGDALSGLAQFAQQVIATASSNHPEPSVSMPVREKIAVKPAMSVDEIFRKVESIISAELVNEVRLSYEFEVTGNNGGIYNLDLRNPPGSVGKGKLPNNRPPDVKLSLSLDTLEELLNGTMSSSYAYASSKLKVDGNLQDAQELDKVFRHIS